MVELGRKPLSNEEIRANLFAAGHTLEKVDRMTTTAPPSDLPKDAVRHRDICSEFGIAKSTLAYWVEQGELRSWVYSHKERYVSRSAFEKLYQEKRGHN